MQWTSLPEILWKSKWGTPCTFTSLDGISGKFKVKLSSLQLLLMWRDCGFVQWMKSPHKDYIHHPTFRGWSDVETHDFIYCQGDQQDVNIFVVTTLRQPYLRHKGLHSYARLPNKAVDHITIVSGNDSRIIPRNVMACFPHVFSQSWFWAVRS